MKILLSRQKLGYQIKIVSQFPCKIVYVFFTLEIVKEFQFTNVRFYSFDVVENSA